MHALYAFARRADEIVDAFDDTLIADLTGIPESAIHCDIEVGRVPGGPPSLR